MGKTVQKNIPFYRWRNRKRIFNERRLFAWSTFRTLPCPYTNPKTKTNVEKLTVKLDSNVFIFF